MSGALKDSNATFGGRLVSVSDLKNSLAVSETEEHKEQKINQLKASEVVSENPLEYEESKRSEEEEEKENIALLIVAED